MSADGARLAKLDDECDAPLRNRLGVLAGALDARLSVMSRRSRRYTPFGDRST